MKNTINIVKRFIVEHKKSLVRTAAVIAVICTCFAGLAIPRATNADLAKASYIAQKAVGQAQQKAVKTIKAVLTAYSSSPEETDDSPFITASGKLVRDGIIANNLLPFGTKIRIPKLYGNKVFTVEDRMSSKKASHQFDVWMPNKPLAISFGVKTADIEVLEN
jgi:3D (Asp-Asp-Asp) domain-containing protein